MNNNWLVYMWIQKRVCILYKTNAKLVALYFPLLLFVN